MTVIISDSNDTIKFHCVECGEISTDNGDTVFSNLLMLGVFAPTSKLNGKKMRVEYQTDAEGLEVLEMKNGVAVELLSDAVVVLGVMLTYVDKCELTSNQLNTYAWLIPGLGELLGMVSRENSEVQHTLTQLNKN